MLIPCPARTLPLACVWAALAGSATLARPAVAQGTPAQGAPAHGAPAQGPPASGAAPFARLTGTVYDSLTRGPLAGATVQAVRLDNATSARTGSTDSTGVFQLDSLTPGRYMVGFLHPTLDALGVQITPVVVVVDGRPLPPVALAVPGPAAMHSALCPPPAPGDSTGAVAGSVRNAVTGDAPAGATVVVSWTEVSVTRQGLAKEPHRVPVKVRDDGGFVVCGVPTDGPLQLSAGAPGLTSGLVEVTPVARQLLLQPFTVGPVAHGGAGAARDASSDDSVVVEDENGIPRPATGTARVAGRVTGADGQPLRGARVRVWGTDARAETGSDGRFALGDLPAGTFTLEVRAIGLAPSRRPVDLVNGRTTEVPVAMAKPAAQLERVTVLGTPTERSRFFEEFAARRRSGLGRFFTAEDIQRQHALDVTDVLRGVAMLHPVPRGARGNVLRGRAGCVPAVWLDGALVRGGANDIDDLVPANAVQAIEVYGAGTVPAQFNVTGAGGALSRTTGAACGTVVIWTAR